MALYIADRIPFLKENIDTTKVVNTVTFSTKSKSTPFDAIVLIL